MKLHRIAAPAIGVAIVAASALGLSSSALAATPGVTYVTATDIVQTNTPGDAGWTKFTGNTFSSSISGLAMPTNNMLSYGIPTPIIASTGSALIDFARPITFTSSDNSELYVGITLFDTNDVDNLIFSGFGTDPLSDPTAGWFSTNPIGALDSDQNPVTLAQLDAELSTNPALADWTIESFDLQFYSPVTLYTMTVNGEHFSFLPEPVVTAAPTTVITTDLAADGVTVTTSGFLPTETVEYSMSDGDSGSAGTATNTGGFSFTYRSGAPAGSYTLTLVGGASAVAQSFDFTVTPAAVADNDADPDGTALAATGTDSLAPLALGGVLLLGGAVLTIVALKTRRTV